MHQMRLLNLLLAFFLPASVIAAPSSPAISAHALREECSAFSQAGMHDCLAKKAASSQKELRQAEERATDTLSKWDEDGKYVSQSKSRLATSIKDFSKYRDTQCDFQASLSGGGAGNSREIGRLACVSELNYVRARQLLEAVNDLPLK
ncbi:DUF1311 domain-containing protein [Acidovorax sp. GBBC 3334]|nr:lysozyme inhibitor LprI family protein [Acidovorax sp. GBBC 3334]MDA8454934.1 DUF1311 domain-containing protein [Acidovorax sp. GBBC 3334]